MRPQARSGTGRLDPRSFLSLPWIVSQRGAVAAPVLTKTLTAKNQRGGVRQPVRHRPSAVGNEPKRNARRPCMITQRLGAEEGDTPVDQQPARCKISIRHMTAAGQTRSLGDVCTMSALPPKADIRSAR